MYPQTFFVLDHEILRRTLRQCGRGSFVDHGVILRHFLTEITEGEENQDPPTFYMYNFAQKDI